MNKQKIRKMIDSGFSNLSSEKIKQLIEAEVSKGENADTDYIDLCFELLEVKENQPERKKYRLKYVLIAAIITVIAFSVVTVSVTSIKFNIPENVGTMKDGNVEMDINLDNIDKTADGYQLLDSSVAKEIESVGITPVTFPEEFLKENCVVKEIIKKESTESPNMHIIFDYDGHHVSFSAIRHLYDTELTGYWIVHDVISADCFYVNGMDVLFFERENSVSIDYVDNNIHYNIYIASDTETAMKLVNSIK